MTLTLQQYRLLVRLYQGHQSVRPTNQPARKLVELGLAQWSTRVDYRKVLVITKEGRERI
jgi:hypothetical protein